MTPVKKRNNRIMLSAVGIDSPGLVAKMTTKIFDLGGNIVDVEETCRRGLFSIFLVIDFAAAKAPIEQLIQELEAIEKETGLKVVVKGYDRQDIVLLPGQSNHLVTIIGVDRPGIIAKISTFFSDRGVNIENVKMIARGELFSMELIINTDNMVVDRASSSVASLEEMKTRLKTLCQKLDLSVVIQSENIYRRTKKLVVFDVESSLVRQRSLGRFLKTIKDRIKKAGTLPKFPAGIEIQAHVMAESAKLLKGIPIKEFEKFSEMLQINPGTYDLISILKSMGFKIALISSGLNFFVKRIFEIAGVDYAFANSLRVDENGYTTGELQEPIIGEDTKSDMLDFILSVEDIHPDQVIVVGDGTLCAHTIKKVGLSIAFHSDVLRHGKKDANTDGILKSNNIFNILYCLGISRSELDYYFDKSGMHNNGAVV